MDFDGLNFKCIFCHSYSFPFSTCSDSEFLDLFCDSPINVIALDSTTLNNLIASMINDEKENSGLNNTLETDENHIFNFNDHYISCNDVADLLPNKNDPDANFTVLSLNIRSIINSNNFTKLESLVSSLSVQPSLIALTETWLRPNQLGSFANLPGYIFISNSRTKYKGGGVAFYLKDNLTYSLRLDLNIMEEKIFESIFVDIRSIDIDI